MNKNLFLILSISLIFLVSAISLASADTTISSCGQNLNASGVYLLNQSITSTATCLTTNSSNVVIDCAGNTITYGTAGTANSIGISALHPTASRVNLTIKNCILVKNSVGGSGGNAIMLTQFANSTIVNNTIRNNGTSGNKGIYILTGASGNNISKNTIVTSGTSANNYGIYLAAGTSDSIIEYNNITTGKGTATTDNYGIRVDDPRANIIGNNVYTFGSGDSNHGIFSYVSTSARIVNNTIYTSGTTGNNRGIYLSSSDYNYIANNTINTTGQASPGIYLSTSNSPNILNNQINSTADAVYITSSVLTDFTSANISRDNTRFGRNITVYGGGTLTLPCPNNTVINNPADGALKFIGCKNITVQNWYRPNRDTDGLLFVNSDYNKIINNTINGGLEALDMVNGVATCDNNTIANNTFSSFGYLNDYAIRIYGTYNVISGNSLSTSGVTSGNNAINIQSDFNNITNNVITTGGSSGNIGINLEANVDNNLIENNMINTSGTSSGNSGIYFVDSCLRNIVRNNTITTTGTSGNFGMRLVSASNNNIVEYNTFYTKGSTSGNNGLDLYSSSNNIFRFNNVYAGYGAGTTDNDALSLLNSINNTFSNNILFANGTATSITSSSIFLQSNSDNNTFVNNIITKSVGNAIELDFLTTYPEGNTFQNNSLNNISGSDLFFLDASINDTSFVNQPIRIYNFTGIGGTISVENTQLGKITFLSPVNGSWTNMSSDIVIALNLAQINDSGTGLNKSANITLRGLSTGFNNPIILKNGVQCTDCYNFTSLNAGNVTFNVTSWSNYSIAGSGDNIPPVITIISPQNITYGSNSVLLNYTATDNTAVGTCWYNIDSSPNTTLPGCTTASLSGLNDGSHTVRVYANDTLGNTNYSSVNFGIDTTPPQWSNMINSTPITYSSSTSSYFNITWSGGAQNVLFESDFSGTARNYSMSLISGEVYGFNAIIPAGTFYWKSIANDSFGYTNVSGTQTFTIGKATPSLSLLLNGEANDKSVSYGTQSDASASETNSGDADLGYSLYRDGTVVSNPEVLTLGAGTYVYVYNTSGGANYSSGSLTRTLTISKSSSSVRLLLNGNEENITTTYGTDSNATAIGTNGNPILYRDGTVVSNPEILTLGVGTAHNYTAIIADSDNVTGSSVTHFLTVNRATPSLSLLIDGIDSDASSSIGINIAINASAISPLGENVELYEDNVLVDSGLAPSSIANYATTGNRIWKVNISESGNYTSAEKSHTISIIDTDYPQYDSSLKESPSDPATYSSSGVYEFNITWTDNIGISEVILEFNGTNYSFSNGQLSSNGDEYFRDFSSLGVGSYNYRWYANDTSNNWVATPVQTYTINKAITALFLTMTPSNSVSYGTSTSVTCSANNAESSVVLTRNAASASNPDSNTFGVGSYNYACTAVATENYTSASSTGTLVVGKASPSITLKLNGQASDMTVIPGSVVDITAEMTSPTSGEINLTENDAEINYGISPIESIITYPSAGTFTINANYAGNENYTSGSKSYTLTVQTSGGSSGGSHGGGSSRHQNTTTGTTNVTGFGIPGLEIEKTSSIVANPGENRKVSLNARNSGGTYLNKCKLAGKGNYSDWIGGEGTKDLSIGQQSEFLLTLNVPGDSKPGKYNVGFSIACHELTKDGTLEIEIIQKKLSIGLIDAKKDGQNIVISYSLVELAGEEQEVDVKIALFGTNNERIVEKDEKRVIQPNSNGKFETTIELPEGSEVNFNLLINANSKIASAFVQEYVLLDNGKISGLVSLDGEDTPNYIIAAMIVTFLVFAFFIARRIVAYERMGGKKSILSYLADGLIHQHRIIKNEPHRHERVND